MVCFVCAGSPPYARGQCHGLRLRFRHGRFTPVRTGTILHRSRPKSAGPVHPRTHGDNRVGPIEPRLRVGSPPYARGQFVRVLLARFRERFTPVRTGTMQAPVQSCSLVAGSPPYARGQCNRSRRARRANRFTPVRTGTICFATFRSGVDAVHPRTHGDNGWRQVRPGSFDGSPPYARGQLQGGGCDAGRGRFTPVRTGTMFYRRGWLALFSVHPRTHGDNKTCHEIHGMPTGSPPYARGQ